ncbi:hypothetical protein L0F63_005601 [Massospora cicadina]|nr:hypothetical protein L0F63_005601 [Massospora cicadina]
MLYLCFIQTITVSCLILYVAINDQNDVVYRLVFLVGKIFALIICWDAVTHKNTIQAISFGVFNFFCLFYAVLQLRTKELPGKFATNTSSTSRPSSWSRLAIYREYGWKIFKKLGADKTIHRMYLHHQVLIVLLQLELFFSIAVAVQLATLLTTQTSLEKWLQIGLGIPVSVFVLALGFYALVKENRVVMIFVILCHCGTLGYFTYRLIKIFLPRLDGRDPYANIWKYLTFTLSIVLALNALTLSVLMLCYADFGKGLFEQIQLHRARCGLKEAHAMVSRDKELSPLGIQPRWELD